MIVTHQCPECDSQDVAPFHGADDVMECRTCGAFFEDDQFLVAEQLRRYSRRQIEQASKEY